MRVLVDTNILTRVVDSSQADYHVAQNAIDVLAMAGRVPCLVPQNLYEFWVVSTRPVTENGLGMNVLTALSRLNELRQVFELLDETPAFRPAWEELVTKYSVQGKAAHDARLVVAMKVHGLSTILTFNKKHFLRYEGIAVISPNEVHSKASDFEARQ